VACGPVKGCGIGIELKSQDKAENENGAYTGIGAATASLMGALSMAGFTSNQAGAQAPSAIAGINAAGRAVSWIDRATDVTARSRLPGPSAARSPIYSTFIQFLHIR
jgi:hypothetical protein